MDPHLDKEYESFARPALAAMGVPDEAMTIARFKLNWPWRKILGYIAQGGLKVLEAAIAEALADQPAAPPVTP